MKFKSFIFAGAAAIAALCSCNKETVPAAVANNEIVFGLKGLAITKSVTESNAGLLQAGGFNVAAVTSGNATLFNALASYDSENLYYKTAATYYWPASGTMNFYACYPTTQAVTVDNGVATLAYEQNGETDLIAAKVTGASKSATPVALTFNHVLSQVLLTAKGAVDDGLTYKITGINISMPTSGTYNYATNDWTRSTQGAVQSILSASKDVTATASSVGEVLSVIPGEISISVEYTVYSGSIALASFTKSATTAVTMGKKSTLNLTLPYDEATPITFTVTVNEWGSESQDIELS